MEQETERDPRKRCQSCGLRMSLQRTPDDPDGVDCEAATRPGYCRGCDGHLGAIEDYDRAVADAKRRGVIVRGPTIHTNESHDPSDWSWR